VSDPDWDPLGKQVLRGMLDQAAGGGRTKLVLVGRKIPGTVVSIRAIGTATITGTVETLCVFILAFGVEQIEQECRAVFAPSGCE